MVIFYKKWKKYNDIQLTKKHDGLKYPKNDKSSTLPRPGHRRLYLLLRVFSETLANGNRKNEIR